MRLEDTGRVQLLLSLRSLLLLHLQNYYLPFLEVPSNIFTYRNKKKPPYFSPLQYVLLDSLYYYSISYSPCRACVAGPFFFSTHSEKRLLNLAQLLHVLQ